MIPFSKRERETWLKSRLLQIFFFAKSKKSARNAYLPATRSLVSAAPYADWSGRSRHLVARSRATSVGTAYAGPTAAGKTRVQPNFLAVILATTKNSWWSRKKFLALRIFRVVLRAAGWWSSATSSSRPGFGGPSTARSKELRARCASSPSRHRAFDPACRVCGPCVVSDTTRARLLTADGPDGRVHALCDVAATTVRWEPGVRHGARPCALIRSSRDDTLDFAPRLGRLCVPLSRSPWHPSRLNLQRIAAPARALPWTSFPRRELVALVVT